jgi:16S rRNA (guanine527-N7)-methyltransferase
MAGRVTLPARPMAETEFGPEDFAARSGVSRETLSRLKAYLDLLQDWNARHNLVSDASLRDSWRRHFWDSAQLLPLIPDTAKSLVDLGSGAGFPGLVLAELMRDRPGMRTVLYEATGKKARFLEAIAARLALPVEIRNARIESARPEPFDVITARALAPLPALFPYAQRFWGARSLALLLKSQNVGSELTEARKSWRMRVDQHPSQSDPSGLILEVRELRRGRRNRPD